MFAMLYVLNSIICCIGSTYIDSTYYILSNIQYLYLSFFQILVYCLILLLLHKLSAHFEFISKYFVHEGGDVFHRLTILSQRPGSKSFRLARPYGLCFKQQVLPLQLEMELQTLQAEAGRSTLSKSFVMTTGNRLGLAPGLGNIKLGSISVFSPNCLFISGQQI